MAPKLRPRNCPEGKAQTLAPPTLEATDLSDIPKGEPLSVKSKPPVYIIDLSQPPSQRYQEVAKDFKSTISELTQLFDTVLESIRPRWVPIWFLRFLAWAFLYQLSNEEQTKELKGMSKALGLPMYLLVAYNVLLDLLMGCTSGGVLVKDRTSVRAHMMHFRTLDWGMPELRKAIVQYHFVEEPGGKVIATTIGYVGFVGVLTGVKPGLGVSLNFRPYHDHSGWTLGNLQYYWHLLLVLLGCRPSIAAQLRRILLPDTLPKDQKRRPRHDGAASQRSARPLLKQSDIDTNLKKVPTSAAYLIFCTGNETFILEKDLCTATTWRSSAFVTATNHDKKYESPETTKAEHSQATHDKASKQSFVGIGMQDIIDESIQRKKCLADKWEAWISKQKRTVVQPNASEDIGRRGEHTAVGIRIQDLKKWMLEYPVCNEDTHFVCVMDPVAGAVKWVRCFAEGEVRGGNSSGSSCDQ